MNSTVSTLPLSSDIMLKHRKAEARNANLMSLVESGLNVIPFVPVGTIIKNAANQIGTYRDLRFAQKLETFLFPLLEDFDKDKFDSFLEKVGDQKENVSQYLIRLLDAAETDEKADMMGCIYHAAVLGQIGHEEMLRYCDIIRKCFVFDLKQLPKYLEPTDGDSITCQNLINVGLIDNYSGGMWKDEPDVVINDFGRKLYDILSNEGYYNQK